MPCSNRHLHCICLYLSCVFCFLSSSLRSSSWLECELVSEVSMKCCWRGESESHRPSQRSSLPAVKLPNQTTGPSRSCQLDLQRPTSTSLLCLRVASPKNRFKFPIAGRNVGDQRRSPRDVTMREHGSIYIGSMRLLNESRPVCES